MDTSRTVTPKPTNNTSDEHLRAGRICVTTHNDEVLIKLRALNTFLEGLAELGVDKRLIKNKKILSDLLEKEKVYRENEGEGDDDSDRSDISDSSDGEESHSESNDVESDSESDQERIIQQESSKPCHHCQNWNMSVTAVVKVVLRPKK